MNKLIFILAFLLLGCNSLKKSTRQVLKAQSEYPTMVAEKCALWYPPKIIDSISIQYLPGEIVLYNDTIQVNCDSAIIYKKENVPTIVNVPLQLQKPRVDTFRYLRIQQIENTALVESLKGKLLEKNNTISTLQSDLHLSKNNKNFWHKLAIVLLAYLSLKTALRLFFPTNLLLKKLP